jgi:hypothetical protein
MGKPSGADTMKKTLMLFLLLSGVSAQSWVGGDIISDLIGGFLNLMSQTVSTIAGTYITNLIMNPDLREFADITRMHSSFTWLGGFFMIALTFQGVKYVMSADSPGARANAKLKIQKTVFGMIIVSINGTLYLTALELSNALSKAFIGDALGKLSALDLMGLAASLSLMCFIVPLGFIFMMLFFLTLLIKSILVIVLYILFPLITALYYSQIGMLERIGAKGLNLTFAALMATPVMAILLHISLHLMGGESKDVLSVVMGFGGILTAALSPMLLLGLLDKFASIAGMAGTGLAGITGGLIGGPIGAAAASGLGGAASNVVHSSGKSVQDSAKDFSQSSQQTVKNDLKKAGEHGNNAAHTAAGKNYDTTQTDDVKRFLETSRISEAERDRLAIERLADTGHIRLDENNIIQPGDAGKRLIQNRGQTLNGYYEMPYPHGKGFGDDKSIRLANQNGLLSDGKVVMKDAAQATIPSEGRNYTVTSNQNPDGSYNLIIQGADNQGRPTSALRQMPSDFADDANQAIQKIQDEARQTNQTPDKALKLMEGKLANINNASELERGE